MVSCNCDNATRLSRVCRYPWEPKWFLLHALPFVHAIIAPSALKHTTVEEFDHCFPKVLKPEMLQVHIKKKK